MPKFTKEQVAHNIAVAGWSPEEIQEYINIATELLVEFLSDRGATAEELHTKRKQIVETELAFIDAEIARLEGTEPLPTGSEE